MIRKIGDFVSHLVQEEAESVGDDDRYCFCHDDDAYFMFRKDTGEVVWVGVNGLLGQTGYWIAFEEFNRLRGINA